jgi:6-phosphogluconolactonase (cycloisomerase 2 family)
MPSANPRFGVIRVISLTALIVNIAIAILLAPAAWSQSGQSRSQFAYIAGNSFVSAYVIDNTTGALSEINGSPFRTGDWARGVAADPQGRFLYIPNWYSANVSAYLIDGNTGALSAIPGSPFPAGDHPAAVAVDPLGRFVYIANQFSGTISVYSINATMGGLTPVTGSPFRTYSWPVGMAVGPSGRFLYVANFWGQVSVYAVAGNGSLAEIPGSPYPAGVGTFQVAIPPSGKFAYAAAQFSDGVFAYSIDGTTGALTEISGSPFPAGSDPYFIAVDPSGRFVYTANFYVGMYSGNVSGYTIDAVTGILTAIPGSPFPAGYNPGGIATDLSGRFVYTANDGSSTASGYTIDPSSGTLTPIPGSPFATAINPISVTTVQTSGNPTSVSLASSLNPSIYGQKVVFTAAVSTTGQVPPTGKILFTWSDYTIGTATLNSSGIATLTKSNLNADPYPLTAVYKGDANNPGATSPVLNQTVLQATSSATITSSVNPSAQGQAVTFSAKITSPTVTPTGPVTFSAGTTVLGTFQLSGGKASYTTTSLPAGSTVIKVTYNGNSNVKGISATVTQVVQP